MIISKCPLRVSLVGGGSDLQEFLNQYGKGACISFPTQLSTYTTINRDSFGLSSQHHKYIVNYSHREEVKEIAEIKNDIARECFSYFNTEPTTCSLTSDIFSTGSGLASSSSYLISLIKALLLKHGMHLSNENVCGLAINLERKFNPLTGYQDPYGCGIGGFKRLDFSPPNEVRVKKLPHSIFNSMHTYLIHTGVHRQSTNLLKNLDISKFKNACLLVDEMEKCIIKQDSSTFLEIIREGWLKKKEGNPQVASNPKVKTLDEALYSTPKILAHRLCGAGNGGFFLALSSPKWSPTQSGMENISIRVNISQKGAQATKL